MFVTLVQAVTILVALLVAWRMATFVGIKPSKVLVWLLLFAAKLSLVGIRGTFRGSVRFVRKVRKHKPHPPGATCTTA